MTVCTDELVHTLIGCHFARTITYGCVLSQTGEVTDAHSLVAGRPVVDECTQDWTLLSAEADDESLVFEAERALDTGDAQDRAFTDDTQDGKSTAS